SVRVFCIYGCGACGEYVEARGEPMLRKKASTSRAPTLAFHFASGGNVTTLNTEPPSGGSIECGRCSVSSTIFAGVPSVTHMRCDAKPARAGSICTSGD